VFIALAVIPLASAEEILWIDSLDISLMRQARGEPKANLSVLESPLSLGGKEFKRGIGTNAESQFFIDLKGRATRFTAMVGVDNCAADAAGVTFKVYGDRKLLFDSDEMHPGGEPVEVDVDVTDVHILALLVEDFDGANYEDTADWADAKIHYSGEKPVAIVCPAAAEVGVLTPATPGKARINGPRVFGVRPDSPFLYTIPATSERPLTFSAEGLPAGLILDPVSGRITGKLTAPGEYKVVLHARNERSAVRRPFRIVCGEQIALTPPMGWTNRFGRADNTGQQKIKDAADALVATGLAQHGWSYVCIDDGWQGTRQPPSYALQPNERFPDMSDLCAYVHDKGLKIGLYSTPWRTTLQGFNGGSADDGQGGFKVRGNSHGKVAFCTQDAHQFAEWGVDFMRYEWRPIDVESTEAFARALQAVRRDIVLGVANSAPLEHAKTLGKWAQCVQTVSDPPDRWSRLETALTAHAAWSAFSGPGHWNDMDILLTGLSSPDLYPPTGLTQNEQYAQMSLWCLNATPLFFSTDPALLKDVRNPQSRFTVGLLSNDEVIDIHQDELGQQARRIRVDEDTEVWVKALADGSKAVGLFNRSLLGTVTVEATWEELGLKGRQRVRDVWRQKDVGTFEKSIRLEVNSHGVMLLSVRAE